MDYETIKQTAKELGVSVNDYLVLSPGNDPFYVGSPGQMEKAKWFAEIYKKMGEPDEFHLRRVHYWLVSQKPPYKKPDGSNYENSHKDWQYLVIASKYARYSELVPTENIIDRRNPEPKINLYDWSDEVPSETKEGIDADDIIEGIAKKFYCWNPHNTQAYHMEMWCEKSTMNDILEPLAKEYGMNLVTGLGELSITAVYKLIQRLEELGKPVRIFYISDFDPAGECMPVSVARKIEFYLRSKEIETSVKLKPIMLTSSQCEAYDLPRTPIKPTEGRKEGFESRHGRGATELDALEALHPGAMARLIKKEVSKYFNTKAWNDVIEQNSRLRERVREFLQGKIGDVLKELDLSEFDEFESQVSDEVEDDGEDWLLNSELDYDEQMTKFKEFKSQESK